MAYGTIRTDADIDARIIAEARAGSAARWPKNKLPSDVAYGTIPSNADIDARILSQARHGSADRWPASKLPQALLTNAAIDDQTLTFTRNGLADIDIELPGGGSSELADLTLTSVGTKTFTGAETFAAASTTGIAIPASGLLLIEWAQGSSAVTVSNGSLMVRAAALRALTALTLIGSQNNGTQNGTIAMVLGVPNNTGNVGRQGRVLLLGRDSSNNLLVGGNGWTGGTVRMYRVQA